MPKPRAIPVILLLLMLVISACSLSSANNDDDSNGDDQESIIVPDRDNLLVIDDDEATEDVAIIPTNTPEPTSTATTNTTSNQGNNTNTNTNTNTVVTTCIVRTDWVAYTVVSGDTMSSIARRTNSTVNQLATANCINDPGNISVGQQLRVPRVPVSNNQQSGYVAPGAFDSINGNVYTLPAYQRITLSWSGASFSGLSAAEFLYYPTGTNSPVALGTDTNLSDGAAISWFVPDILNGTIVARGNISTGGVRFSADLIVISERSFDDVIGRVEITPPYTNDGINYNFTVGETITLRCPQLSRTNVYRVDFYMGMPSAANPGPIIIASDTNIANGVAASTTLTAQMSGVVTAVALRTDNSRVSTYQNINVNTTPNSNDPSPQGTISISPIVSDFDVVNIEEGELVSVSWVNMPANVGLVEFYYVLQGQPSPVTIGTDSDMANGASVRWLVPENAAGYIEATGRLTGQNHHIALSNPQYFETVPPTDEGSSSQGQAAWQAFENGYMLWRANPDGIYVLNNSGFINYYSGSVYQPLPDNPITDTPPANRILPINGFGKIWGNYDSVRTTIGWALSGEQSYTATFTRFEGSGSGPTSDGYMLVTIPDGRQVRINDGGTWSFVD